MKTLKDFNKKKVVITGLIFSFVVSGALVFGTIGNTSKAATLYGSTVKVTSVGKYSSYVAIRVAYGSSSRRYTRTFYAKEYSDKMIVNGKTYYIRRMFSNDFERFLVKGKRATIYYSGSNNISRIYLYN